jgi:hypothetical protein
MVESGHLPDLSALTPAPAEQVSVDHTASVNV